MVTVLRHADHSIAPYLRLFDFSTTLGWETQNTFIHLEWGSVGEGNYQIFNFVDLSKAFDNGIPGCLNGQVGLVDCHRKEPPDS